MASEAVNPYQKIGGEVQVPAYTPKTKAMASEAVIPYQKIGGEVQVELHQQPPPKEQEPVILTADQGLLVGPENTLATCPFCKSSIKTTVRYSSTVRTHMAAVLCHLICCCCCLPYCCATAKNADHYCPHCKHYLGTYRR